MVDMPRSGWKCLWGNLGHSVWLGRFLQCTFDQQLVVVNRKARSDPERIDDVIPLWIYRIGMNEDA